MGRGDAYVGLARSEINHDTALKHYASALNDYETAQSLGDSTATEKSESVKKEVDRLRSTEEYTGCLKALHSKFTEGDLDGAADLMHQTDYVAMCDSLDDGFYYYEDEGTAVAVYPNYFYYYGGWSEGLRTGNGVWMRVVYADDISTVRYLYEGEWENDTPNGSGHIVRTNDINKMDIQPGRSSAVVTEVTGNFTNGLIDGSLTLVWHMNTGNTHVWHLEAEKGVYIEQPLPEQFKNHRQQMNSDSYFVGTAEDGADLWMTGKANGVVGFVE